MGIVELGHAGLWVNDLDRMRAFYRDIVGLTETDADETIGMAFFSSRPEAEHHELVLAAGRVGDRDVKVVNQLSWRLDSLDSLLDYHKRFVREGVHIRQIVTHGIALGIYFEDPEGNVNEVYWTTGDQAPQPYRVSISLDAPADQVLAEAVRILREQPPAYDRQS